MAFLTLDNVSFRYNAKNNYTKAALENINLIINKGDFLAIMGPNGSGKTTFIKLIAGLLKPSSGEVRFQDKNLKKIPSQVLAKKIAYVPQFSGSVFPYSIYEIAAMGRNPYLSSWGFESPEDKYIIEENLRLVGLYDIKNKGINEISGGEAQRAFIARALAQEPELILLDEPNAHLDVKHQISIFNLLRKLNIEKQLTVAAISHDFNLASYYCKTAAILNYGKMETSGEIEQALTYQNIKRIFGINADIRKKDDLLSISINPDYSLQL